MIHRTISYEHEISSTYIPIPLTYITINNHKYDNIILIHDKINNPHEFALYANHQSLSIIYNVYSSNDEIITLLNNNFNNIKRIAFVFHNSNSNALKEFTNNKPLFDFNDLDSNTEEYSENLKFIINLTNKFNVQNLDFLACNTLRYEHWKKYFNILERKTNAVIRASNNLTGNTKYGGDWILKNTMNLSEHLCMDTINLLKDLELDTLNLTENLYMGQELFSGKCIPENTMNLSTHKCSDKILFYETKCNKTNIKNIYFTNNIENYQYTFAPISITPPGSTFYFRQSSSISNIEYSYDDISWATSIDSTNWPVTIINGTILITLNVVFNTNLYLTTTYGNTYGYFIIGSDNIIINGNNKVLNIDSIIDYPGLFQNGIFSSLTSFTNITIEKLGVTTSNNSTLVSVSSNIGGWICQGYFGIYTLTGSIIVNNCYSTGPIAESAGGIFGASAGEFSSASISANYCYSTGNIGTNAGGIFGYYTANNAQALSNIVAYYCYTEGNIGSEGGGIFGSSTGFNARSSSTISAINCYSIGIIGSDAGGIFGQGVGQSSDSLSIILAQDCYSTGSIEKNAGGIFGSLLGSQSGGTISANYCYSTGSIAQYAGGIIGATSAASAIASLILSANYCYSTGNIGSDAGGIFGILAGETASSSATILANSCYTIGSITTVTNGIFGSFKFLGTYIYCIYLGGSSSDITPSQIQIQNNWIDGNAKLTIKKNDPINSKWIIYDSTKSWLLSSFDSNIYNPNIGGNQQLSKTV